MTTHSQTFLSLLLVWTVSSCATPPAPGPALPGDRLAPWRASSGFVPNAGQWHPRARFRASMPGARIWLEQNAIAAEIGGERPTVVRFRFPQADPSVEPSGEQRLPGAHAFFLGDDADAWRTGLPGYGAVVYRDLVEDTDLRVHETEGLLEWDLVVAPGAGPDGLKVRCEGIDRLETTRDGSLLLRWGDDFVRLRPPVTWEVAPDGGRREIVCSYRLLGRCSFAFSVQRVDPTAALVIDPVLDWSTYLGGSNNEWACAVHRDAAGRVTVAGETTSTDFPVTSGVFDPTYNGFGPPTADVFVSRFDSSGGLLWSTYLGGRAGDKPLGLVCDAAGVATVVGTTASNDFPTTPGASRSSIGGSSDAFVARLSANGSQLIYSTLLGGSSSGDVAESVALDSAGRAVVAGVTSSTDFPTTAGAHQGVLQGSSDAFVARVDGGTSLGYSTLVGGGSGDVGKSVAVTAGDEPVLAGVTSSADFPTTPGAHQGSLIGNSDAFVTRLAPDGSAVLASTLLGGGSGEVGEGVALGPGDLPVVVGVTSSNDFPVTANAFGSTPNGSSDSFAAGLDAGGALRFATLVGGGGGDVSKGVAVTATGTVIVGGQTSSNDFPTTPGAVVGSGRGSADGYVFHLAADGSGLLYSTLLGGSGSDGGENLSAIDVAATLVGVTNSRNYPVTQGALGSSLQGNSDAFVSTVNVSPPGVVRYGSSTPACSGPIPIEVTAQPNAGEPDFGFTCMNAPPGALGFLVVGFVPSMTGVPVAGITAYLDPTQLLLAAPTTADGRGFAAVPLPLTNLGPGPGGFYQFAWFNTPACGGAGTLSASDAMAITIQ